MTPRFAVGLDLASSLGWSVLNMDGTRYDSGVWDCSIDKKMGEGAGMRALKARRYTRQLQERLRAALGPGQIIVWGYELVRAHVGTIAAQVHGGVRDNVLGELESLGEIAYRGVTVQGIKKTATGKGNASKAMMMKAAREHWSLKSVGEDEADALWCAEAIRLELLED